MRVSVVIPLLCLGIAASVAKATPTVAQQLRQLMDRMEDTAMYEYRQLLADSSDLAGSLTMDLQVAVEGELIWVDAQVEPEALQPVADSLRKRVQGVVLVLEEPLETPLEVRVPMEFLPPEE